MNSQKYFMSKPDFIIESMQRTYSGALPTSIVQQVRSKLMRRGFILLPSDTCYSLGALAIDESIRKNINIVLNRKDEPVSLAFSSYLQVQRFVEVGNTAALLFERFTPGPITIVCKAKNSVSKEFVEQALGSFDETIGVRISDSFTEREVAACAYEPVMSVAIRDSQTGEPVQDFEKALDIVSLGVERLGGAGWAAIEGDAFYGLHSTIIKVVDSTKVELLREGDIPFDEIMSATNSISRLSMEDWG